MFPTTRGEIYFDWKMNPDKENDWINLSACSDSKIGIFLQNASFLMMEHGRRGFDG